jgi:hypothetical protein
VLFNDQNLVSFTVDHLRDPNFVQGDSEVLYRAKKTLWIGKLLQQAVIESEDESKSNKMSKTYTFIK